MRYEDASQTGSAGSEVNARDDADNMASNDFGPATGNIITGAGTVSGATGTDSSGHIVAIQGAGGSDNTFADGKLEIAGQYGTLSIDADGNYSYVRNPGSPDAVSDTFTYTLANDAGATDTANLVISIGNLPMLQAQGTQTIQTANGVVVLPAGVELSDVRVVGRDLVVTLPDGSTMVIPDGAIFVPQLVVNGVEVPASNLAALLIDSEPKPGAGDATPTQLSSGGNFEVPVQPLDPGVPLGDLIPPTELQYIPPEVKELFPGAHNEPPVIGVSSVNVSEEGVSVIAAPNPDTTGSPDTTNSPVNGGNVPVSDPDGDPVTLTLGAPSESLTSQGVAITWSVSGDGHTVTGSAGANTVITIVINDDGDYTVTLLRPVDHPTAGGEQGTSFVVPVSASDGEDTTIGGAITVTIEDDSPTIVGRIGEPDLVVDDTTLAINDTDAFSAAVTVSYGADGPAGSNSLIFALGTPGGPSGIIDVATGEAVNLSLVGGVVEGRTATSNLLVFTVSVDGSGNVTLDQVRAVQHNDPNDSVETGPSAATLSSDGLVTLNIVATDRDGDQASISVNIGQNLHFEDDGPSIGNQGAQPALVVDETVLATDATQSFASAFTPVFGNDGAAAGGGVTYALGVVAGPSGLIDTVTGQTVILSLVGGVVEGHTSGTNDLVFTVTVAANGDVTLNQLRAVVHPNALDPNDSVTLTSDNLITLTATATDKDGDHASASIDIGTNLSFLDDAPSVTLNAVAEPNLIVDETNFGGDAGPTSFAGLFNFNYGADGPAVINPVQYVLGINAGSTGLVDTLSGLAVQLFVEGGTVVGRAGGPLGDIVLVISVDASGNVTLDQQRAVIHPNALDPNDAKTFAADNLITLAAAITDKDGDIAAVSSPISIAQDFIFLDDGPIANNDTDTVAGGTYGPETGNVITGVGTTSSPGGIDNDGNDEGGHITAVTGFGGSVGVDQGGGVLLVDGHYGSLTINPDGSYSYTRDPGTPGNVHDIFTYTLADGDNDTDPATLDIFIANATPRVPQQREVNQVAEQGLPPRGSEPAGSGEVIPDPNDNSDTSEIITGTADIGGGDGPLVITIDGVTVTGVVGQTFLNSTGKGLLEITSFSQTEIGYKVTLLDNTSGNFTALSYHVVATDQDGDFAEGDFVVSIIDDHPTATNDFDSILGGNGPATGNVMTGVDSGGGDANITDGNADITGADNASLTKIESNNVLGNVDTTPSGGNFVVDGQYGTLTINEDGTYSYLRTTNVGGVQDVFTYTLTDGDGDTTTATLTIDIIDNSPIANKPDDVLLDDDALAGGIAGGTGDNVDSLNAHGFLTGTGGDPDLDTFFAATQDGLPAGFTLNPSSTATLLVINQNGSPVLTVSLVNETGEYQVTQTAPITHPDGLDENNIPNIGIKFYIQDADGDQSPVETLTINIDDDTPTASVTSVTEPQLTVDETILANDASASFAGLFSTAYGADGAGSTAYALNVSSQGVDSGLIDVASGQHIFLFKVSDGLVEGRVGGVGGAVSFSVTANTGTGLVTLNQVLAIQHSPDTGPDQPISMTTDSLLTLGVVVTDHDNDVATANVNIASNLVFEDDAPSASASGSEPILTVDETVLATDASASFAGLFSTAYGADGAGTTAYALNVSSQGVDSGLIDVASGQHIFLFKVSDGLVEGRVGGVGGAVSFSVTANTGTGLVTLNQVLAIQHSPDTGPDQPISMTTDSLLTLGVVVTDKDGDVATANVNIASNLVFEDDAPSASASGSEPILTVDETILANDASASFAGLFSTAYGADGAGTTAYALNVSSQGVDSGLIDVASGQHIFLFKVSNGLVEGRVGGVGGAVSFSVTANTGTGLVTLNQVLAIQHSPDTGPDQPISMTTDSLLTLGVVVTDKDGDVATANVNIASNLVFEDDAPSAGLTLVTEPTLTVDETILATNASASFAGLFSTAYGADGAGTTAYALNVSSAGVDSGLIDVASGQHIFLYKVSNALVEGRVGSGGVADPLGAVAFSVAANTGTGLVTLDQVRALQHSPDTGPDQPISMTTDSLITLGVVVTDKDGDIATANAGIAANLVFEDDAPTITSVTDPLNIDNDATPSGVGNFVFTVGADANTDNNDISVSGFTVSVNGTPIVPANVHLTAGTEDAHSASYTFSFDYDNGSGGATAQGTLVFYKDGTIAGHTAGTYEVALTNGPIEGITLTSISTGEAPVGYHDNTSTLMPSNPDVSVVELDTNLFVQFTGYAESGSGTGANNIKTSTDNDLSGGDDENFANGEVLVQLRDYVTISGLGGNGVHGDTMNKGEILDFDLFTSNPTGFSDQVPTGKVETMFVELDGIGNNEDMIMILKLFDTTNSTFTTRAVYVDNADFFKQGDLDGGQYQSIVASLDSNDALVVIEQNDYNTAIDPTRYVIVGAQLVSTDEGIVGSAIDLNGAVGVAGATTGAATTFAADGDDTGFKIKDIGFVTTSTTEQQATIEFDVTVTDKDGDSVTQNDVTVNIGTPAPPVVLDMNHDGHVTFVDHSAGVAYDYNGDGVSEATAWAGSGDGILVRDANGDGTVTNASEFVFGHDGLTDMQALAGQYGDTLDANDADFGQFKVWTDANMNGVADAGELQSLSDAGITSIGLVSDGIGYSAANGEVQVVGSGSFTRADGSTGVSADAIFTIGGAKATQEVERIAANSNNVALAAAVAAAGVVASSAAAAAPAFDDGGQAFVSNALVAKEAFADLGGTGHSAGNFSALSAVNDGGFDFSAQVMASTSHTAISTSHIGELVSALSIGSAPNALLDATDFSAMMQVQMPTTAMGVAMPSAESLMPAMSGVAALQQNGAVDQIVADALHGGGSGPDINALLNALPGQGFGADAGLHGLATPVGDNVSIGDMGHGGGFTFDAAMFITTEAMVLHVDAVQPVANG